MKTRNTIVLALIVAVLCTAGVYTHVEGQTEKPARERARHRVVHIEEGIIREIPPAPRLCDRLNLRKERMNIADCNLYTEREGRGTPLVLINGGPGGTHHHFHPFFSRAGDFAQVIYYDQRGCGLSDYRPGDGYTLDQAVDDLEHLRQALRVDRWVVLGHSYGGLLAQCYALKYPERLRGLVLVCASMGLPVIEAASRDGEFISPQEREKIDQIRNTPGLSLPQIVYNIHLNGDWKRQDYYKPTPEELAKTVLYEWVHDESFNRDMSRSSNAVDLAGAFALCPIPTLIVESRWDMSWGEDKPKRFAENHPNAKLILFEESAHSPFRDEPDRFFAALQEFVDHLPEVPTESLEPWKTHLAAWRKTRTSPMPEGSASPEEALAIEEFRRIKAEILAGKTYQDDSTPLHAALTQFSKWEPGEMKDTFARLDVLRAPLPPEHAREGSISPIFAGLRQLEDTYLIVHLKGQWIWAGNMGCSLDWRPHEAKLEEWAKQQIEQRAGAKDSVFR